MRVLWGQVCFIRRENKDEFIVCLDGTTQSWGDSALQKLLQATVRSASCDTVSLLPSLHNLWYSTTTHSVIQTSWSQPAAALTGSVLWMKEHEAFCQYPNYRFPKGEQKKTKKIPSCRIKVSIWSLACISLWEGAVVAVRGRRWVWGTGIRVE